MHGLNEGHIAPYTDVEFRLTKYQTYMMMKSWYNRYLKKLLHYDKDKTHKTDGIKII